MDFRQRVSTLREFVRRHRLATTIATPVALGVVVVVVVAALLFATPNAQPQLTASVTTCHDMVTIAVAGRNDSPSATTTKMLVGADGKPLPAATSDDYHSTWEDPVINAPASKVAAGSYAAMYISYPANMSTFDDAVDAGVANTEKVMEAIRQACPNTQFAIVGYSEGSAVARQVAQQIGDQKPGTGGAYGIVDPSKVTGVVILADNGRAAGDGPFPGAQQPFAHPDNFDQNYQTGTTPTPGQGALPDSSGGFGALNGRVASFCSDGDLTCAAPQNISLLQLAVNVGRQINVDDLQNKGLTPATGADVAVTLAKIGYNAFEYIRSQPNWMASKQTFLDVLLKVSDPNYKPGQEQPQQQPSGQQQPGQQQPGQQPGQQQPPEQQLGQQQPVPQQPGQQQPDQAVAQTISSDDLSPLAYLPQKFFNEIIGLIVTNQNTIPVIMSNPYQLTLGPNGTGHHFDYWRDSNSADGKPLTSAEYAAAWLVHLAQQAQAGKQVDTAVQPQQADVAAAYQDGVDVKAKEAQVAKLTTPATPTTTASPTTTTAAPTTTSASPTTTTTASPTTTTTSPTTTTTSPTTTSPTTTTTEGSAPTTTTSPATPTTAAHAAATPTSTSTNPSAAHPASANQSTGTTTNSPADPRAAKPVAADASTPASTPSTSATAAKSVAVLPTTTDQSHTPGATTTPVTTPTSPTTESAGGN